MISFQNPFSTLLSSAPSVLKGIPSILPKLILPIYGTVSWLRSTIENKNVELSSFEQEGPLSGIADLVNDVANTNLNDSTPLQVSPHFSMGTFFSKTFEFFVNPGKSKALKMLILPFLFLPKFTSKENHEIKLIINAEEAPVNYKIAFGHNNEEVVTNFIVQAGKKLIFSGNQDNVDRHSFDSLPPLFPSSFFKKRYTTCQIIVVDPQNPLLSSALAYTTQATVNDLIRVVHAQDATSSPPRENTVGGNIGEFDVLQKTVINVNSDLEKASEKIFIPCDPKSYIRITQETV